MYSSLDKIDILAEIDGRKLVVQTDHRTAQEIEDEPELSVLFAMTRVLNAQSWLASEGSSGGSGTRCRSRRRPRCGRR
jgi:hypothetical protein